VVVSQGADGSIANDLYNIVGIAESGDAAMDQSAFYLNLADAQELLALGGSIHEMVIIADKLDDVPEVTERIREGLNDANLEIAPWQEFARSFYVAMEADKKGSWVMLFIVIMIVAIGVLNTVLMTVLERTREYGVLRAVGTRPPQIFKLVIIEVSLMAIISIIIGLILSLVINYYFSVHGVPMPMSFTYGGMEFTHYYSEVNAHSLYLPAITVMFSALFISIFPAIKAARIAPARALRSH